MIFPCPHLIELSRGHQASCFSVRSLSNCVQNNRDDPQFASRLGSSRLGDPTGEQVKTFEVFEFSLPRRLARIVQKQTVRYPDPVGEIDDRGRPKNSAYWLPCPHRQTRA